MDKSPYEILGVRSNASFEELKSAYRQLVKKHHPDTGGDEETILAINAAWEVLGDPDSREAFDTKEKIDNSFLKQTKIRNIRNVHANNLTNSIKNKVAQEEDELSIWIKNVYTPINKLISQIINPFQSKIKELAGDPYDDDLMESFCLYLEESQHKIRKIEALYRSKLAPSSAEGLAINLYRCFSQIQEALNELNKYTMGYVDNYLHDGQEMIREAKKIRSLLHQDRRYLPKF
tara:strand:+ start:1166 stop:1864 length:699 start_codon:yes stop_codon:yes gene_type:complete